MAATVTEHERALAWALAQARVHRHEIPLGSNSGPFVELCQRATWLPGTGWPWCVAFFMAAWRYGARVKLWWLGAGAYAFLAAAEKAGYACTLSEAVPGDAVILNLGAGHCCMLREKYAGGAFVSTVDGNWADSVELVEHPAAIVRGCVHVPDPIARAKRKPRKPRLFEVATSASGGRKVVFVGRRHAVGVELSHLLAFIPRITISPRGATK